MTQPGRRFAPEAEGDVDMTVADRVPSRALTQTDVQADPVETAPFGGRRRGLKLLAAPLLALAVGGAAVALTTVGGPSVEAAPAPEQAAPSIAARQGGAVPDRDASRTPLKPSSSPAITSQKPAATTAATNAKPKVKPAVEAAPVAQKMPSSAPTTTKKVELAAIIGSRYTTQGVNVRSSSSTSSKIVDTLVAGEKVEVTSVIVNGFRQVRHDGQRVWISNEYLTRTKPVAKESNDDTRSSRTTTTSKTTTTNKQSNSSSSSNDNSPVSTSGCSKSTSITSGITANARAVYQAVCAKYPSVSSFGGYRPSADAHGAGRAVDIMISGSTGWDIANWLRANASRFGISEVIYSQQIWTTQRSGEGWRSMSDRGSATANHHDHVHVTVR